MRLLVVTQYFSPENFRINDLVSGLHARGHVVTVLTGQPNYPIGVFSVGYGWRGPRSEVLLGAKVFRVSLIARGHGGAVRLVLNYLSFAFFASLAASFRLRGTFDAIFVFEPSPVTVGIPAVIAGRRFKAPILFWVLDIWPESISATGAVHSRRLLDWVGYGVRWIYGRCARILVQSRAFVPSVAAYGIPDSRIKYFPNWIEFEYETSADWPKSHGQERLPGEFRLVFAGNVGVAQDFPAILDAASIVAEMVPQVRWVVAGDGRMLAWVRSEVAKRGLNRGFEFLGQLPSAAMPSVFGTADALLVTLRPDPVFSLTIPGKVQSYLSSGKPVLAMLDGEGARVIEEAHAGMTCGAGDVAGLVENVKKLVAMPLAEREAMGACGRAYALAEFDREILFDKLEGWFAEAVEENRCRKM